MQLIGINMVNGGQRIVERRVELACIVERRAEGM